MNSSKVLIVGSSFGTLSMADINPVKLLMSTTIDKSQAAIAILIPVFVLYGI